MVFRILFYPVMVGGALAANLLLMPKFAGKLPLLTLMISVSAIIVIAVTERFRPFRPQWNKSLGDTKVDFLLTNISLPVTSKITEALLGALFFGVSLKVEKVLGFKLWPSQLPLLAQLAIALLISEFGFYWTHRYSHRDNWLWNLHRVHHSSKRLYWINSGRFHPLDAFIDLVVYFTPLVILGVPPQVIALFYTTNAVTGLLEHANINFNIGPFNRIFNSAQIHRWHHAPTPRTYNFGKVLSVWDSVFGSFYFPRDTVDKVGLIEVEVTPVESDLPTWHPGGSSSPNGMMNNLETR